jgi:hypothetical protein
MLAPEIHVLALDLHRNAHNAERVRIVAGLLVALAATLDAQERAIVPPHLRQPEEPLPANVVRLSARG